MIAHAQHTAPQLPHLICIQEEEKNLQMGNINRTSIEVEQPSANTKRRMFGAFIHDSEMTNNEAFGGSLPTLGLQLNPQPLEELPECAFLAQRSQGNYVG